MQVSSQVSHVIPNVSYYYSKSSLGSENVTPDFEFLNTQKIPPTPIPPRAPPQKNDDDVLQLDLRRNFSLKLFLKRVKVLKMF